MKKHIKFKDKPVLACQKDEGVIIFHNYNHNAKIMYKFFYPDNYPKFNQT
jgi:hypothetical protein